MARKRNVLLTRLDIIGTATRLFLEKGYYTTTNKMICSELNISPGTLTYHFAAKEEILTVLIEMLADFQWKKVQELVTDGETPITALCFELTAMASMCENNQAARELYMAAYTGSMTLGVIRKNDAIRAKKVFAEFCSDWTDEMFVEAETLVSGIEYATLHVTADSPSLETRITGAMNTILQIYNVPQERRKMKIEKALGMDYDKFGQQMLEDFKVYVAQTARQGLIDVALKGECKFAKK